jgi:hypothetical protein
MKWARQAFGLVGGTAEILVQYRRLLFDWDNANEASAHTVWF